MKTESDVLKPIHMIAVLCAATGIVTLIGFCFAGNLSTGSKVIITGIILWNFLTGFGIWLRCPWGYYLLKCYLYLLLLGVPIGTIIGITLLKHMKEHNIDSLFTRTSLEAFRQLTEQEPDK